ncbi:MAG: S-layer homology domain-containing protein [Oscillospiraceae bacterium]|nr:S-layer homology domain-containing protein [Oscillospiraceae bacterium]
MKNKRTLSLLLSALILLACVCPAFADAGGKDDPLISKSYIESVTLPYFGNYLSQVSARFSEGISAAAGEKPAAEKKESAIHDITAGGSATLSTGGVFILLSGKARISSLSGAVVNVTVGAAASEGNVTQYCRYVVCEDSHLTVSFTDDSSVYLSSGALVQEGDGLRSPFTDVKRGDWFFEVVVKACNTGLINGMTATSYEPKGLLTYAQTVKLAACMHRLYFSGSVDLKNYEDSSRWYLSYITYAEENGIIPLRDDYDPNKAVSRAEFIEIFYKALPESEYKGINSIPEGSIPDVKTGDASSKEIYAFYRAGILSGYTADATHEAHAFAPESTISRAEVAAIMARMMDKEIRLAFTM